jgi:hypothetical protein
MFKVELCWWSTVLSILYLPKGTYGEVVFVPAQILIAVNLEEPCRLPSPTQIYVSIHLSELDYKEHRFVR